jgi:bifunctional non-homologous end joining protein LigD
VLRRSSAFRCTPAPRLKSDPDGLNYVCFDLPWCDGYDLSRVALIDRKGLLCKLIQMNADPGGVIRFGDHIVGAGPKVLRAACSGGAEGILSKRSDGPYVQRRTRSWTKTKCAQRQEFVIGGHIKARGARSNFGALLMGYYDDQRRFCYAGRVGTGFDESSLRAWSGGWRATRLRNRRSGMHPVPRRGIP